MGGLILLIGGFIFDILKWSKNVNVLYKEHEGLSKDQSKNHDRLTTQNKEIEQRLTTNQKEITSTQHKIINVVQESNKVISMVKENADREMAEQKRIMSAQTSDMSDLKVQIKSIELLHNKYERANADLVYAENKITEIKNENKELKNENQKLKDTFNLARQRYELKQKAETFHEQEMDFEMKF